jgi:RNA polymerase sigma-70 factor (ECF subfamily)
LSTALAQALPVDATRRLYERHSSRIFGFCLSRLGSREEAEDALQTTFLNAQRGLGRGVVPEYELAWLFKIAQNVCHNRHQSARRRRRVESTHDLDALQDVIASPEHRPAVSVEELTRALEAIPARQRRALILREFEGCSYDEIANELGVSVAAVETLIFRARRAVAQQLEQSGARPRTQHGAAASVFELFRWLFGGAAAPLKLAAVTAAVATTATLSVSAANEPAPVAPVSVERSAVVPVSKGRPGRVPPAAARPAGARGSAAQSAGATFTAPVMPAVQTPPGTAAVRPAASSPRIEATTTTPAPIVSAADLTAPNVTLPAITVPSVTVPGVTVPAVALPDLQLTASSGLPTVP